jgi:hypothetical protein
VQCWAAHLLKQAGEASPAVCQQLLFIHFWQQQGLPGDIVPLAIHRHVPEAPGVGQEGVAGAQEGSRG